MRNTLRHLSNITALFVLLPAMAQPLVDITLGQVNGTEHQVSVRPDGAFDGIFSALVFTLRWNGSDGSDIADMSVPANSGLTIAPSGPAVVENGYIYRRFAGFGFAMLSDAGTPWQAGGEYQVLSITFTTDANVELVNDDWTAAHNGDYYVSLNGYDRTGSIYESLVTGMAENTAGEVKGINAWPVPADDVLHFSTSDNGFIALAELVDVTGRVVRKESAINGVGNIPVSGLPQGSYVLRAITAKGTMERNIIVQ